MSQVQTYHAGDQEDLSQTAQMGLPEMRQGEIPDNQKGEKQVKKDKIVLELTL